LSEYYKYTSSYYPGARKLRLTADAAFRKTMLFMTINVVLTIPVNCFFKGNINIVINLIKYLTAIIIFGIVIAGGSPRRGWAWYAGFCAFSVAGVTPVIMYGTAASLALLPLAGICFFMFHKNAPWILDRLGFLEKGLISREIFFSLTCGFIFILFTYHTLLTLGHKQFVPMEADKYVAYMWIGLIEYGMYFGITYGILLRRLLQMKYELFGLIVLNVFLLFVFWLPVLIGRPENLVLSIAALFAGAFIVQFTIAMAFYFCRSTRFVIVSYIVYYMIVKSMV
jgi:hypothetical protein